MRPLALAIALVAACGGDQGAAPAPPPGPGAIVVPERARTAGDPMLAFLPAGADIVVELDLGRVRGNDVVGELATHYLSDGSAASELDPLAAVGGSIPAGPLARADVVVLASYRSGTPEATTIGLIVGGGLTPDDLYGATDLGGGVIAVAPPAETEALRAVAAGTAPGLDEDRELLALRALGMPEKAEGASLRVAARLDFDARVALASQLGASSAPSLVSLWGDVADDVAVVAVLEAPDDDGAQAGAERMAGEIRAYFGQLANEPDFLALGLSPAIRRFQVETRGDRVKVVALIGPRRLSRVVARLKRFLDI
jgi:hypothetical protein